MLSKGEGTTIPVIHESAQATDALRGIFITFEGGEGAGKTTHIRFLSETLRAHGREVLCLREPGGTEVGEQLRAVVLDPANGGMSDEAELLIYEAARAQLMAQVIAPALARGAVVLCDRFTDSTVAYQAYGRGLPRMFVDRVNEFACQGVHPRPHHPHGHGRRGERGPRARDAVGGRPTASSRRARSSMPA